MSQNIEKLIEHWGMSRKDILTAAAAVVTHAREEGRPKCNDRNQYDAWTRTMVAVIEEAA